MPRFSDSKKEFVKNDILSKSKHLFSIYGLKKTSIDDIVKACSIGKGTFYSFFPSKEVLFFILIEIEHEGFKKQKVNELLSCTKNHRNEFKIMLKDSFEYILNNPFLLRVMENEDINSLMSKLPPELFSAHLKDDSDVINILIEKWQSDGIMKKEAPEVIVIVLQLFTMLVSFRKEYPKEIFEKVIATYITFISDGLIIK